ncbi:hypothetical protein ACFQYP_14605 [Nonomuraea antimicrobica]
MTCPDNRPGRGLAVHLMRIGPPTADRPTVRLDGAHDVLGPR